MLETAQMLKRGKHVLLVVNIFQMKIVDASQTVQEEDVESVSGFGGMLISPKKTTQFKENS